jgi:hypothetical protein
MEKAEFHEHVGDANICADLDAAMVRAREVREAAAGPR